MLIIAGVPYADFGAFMLSDGTSVFKGEWGPGPYAVRIEGRNVVVFDDEIDYIVCPD